jgi:hypothetical protein
VGRAEGEEGEGAAGEHHQRCDGDGAPVPAVGEVARRQRDGDERQRLGEADEAEGERIVRDLVDLPADDDGLDLRRDRHAEQADDVPAEVAVAECGVRVVPGERG